MRFHRADFRVGLFFLKNFASHAAVSGNAKPARALSVGVCARAGGMPYTLPAN